MFSSKLVHSFLGTKMICHVKFIFALILLVPELTDGGSVTWYKPTPVVTTARPAEVIPPVILPIYEGNPATLNWSYSLTADLITVVLRFNGGGIVTIEKNGQPGDVNINFRDRFTVSSTTQSATLFISHVDVADDKANGDFTCNLIDSDGNTWKRAVQVKVQVPAYITGISGELTVLEGSKFQLTCEAVGQPEPNVTWIKEKTVNQGNTSVVQEGKELTITNINRADAGEYTCTASNGLVKPENRTVYVNVTYPPKIGNFETEYIAGVLQTLTLNCEAEGNPPPTYTWTPCDPEQVCDKNTLDISQVFNDANYTCKVANIHGNDSKTASVYVGGYVINITIDIISETCKDGKYNQSILEKFKDQVKETFAGKLGYEGVQSISARCGSIIVDLALKFNSSTKERDVITTLNDAVIDGKMGEFSVGAIKGKRPDVKTTSRGPTTFTVGHTGRIAWWIIFIIVLAVVIVLVLLVILVKKKGSCSFPVNNGKHPREVHSDEGRGIATEADNQYAAAGPNVNYRASNPSSKPSVTYEVANRSSEGRRGNKAGAPKEQLPEYAVVDKTKKNKKTPKPGELQYAELGELTDRGQKGTMPRVSGTDTVYADIKS